MKDVFTTLIELVGMAMVAIGFGLRWPWLGLVVGGALLVLIGWLASGQPRTRTAAE